jgi:uncharacterized protein (DUF427 family)
MSPTTRAGSIPTGEEKTVDAVWTYEAAYDAVAEIQDYLGFYPNRADAIEEKANQSDAAHL